MSFFEEEKHEEIHIRIQQRNARKFITIIEGLPNDLDLKKILKYLKKVHTTNGSIIYDKEYGEIIKLQGDQRANVFNSFIEWKVTKKEYMKVHG